mgnify:CR=1 FL=1
MQPRKLGSVHPQEDVVLGVRPPGEVEKLSLPRERKTDSLAPWIREQQTQSQRAFRRLSLT